jgi:hypothetical protein
MRDSLYSLNDLTEITKMGLSSTQDYYVIDGNGRMFPDCYISMELDVDFFAFFYHGTGEKIENPLFAILKDDLDFNNLDLTKSYSGMKFKYGLVIEAGATSFQLIDDKHLWTCVGDMSKCDEQDIVIGNEFITLCKESA